MHIALGSDHAGFAYKQRIHELLKDRGHDVRDFGVDSEQPMDYPRVIRPAALAVGSGELERGVVLGGSGNGEAIVANRVRGVRCALCWDETSAQLARAHNDANMLALGERLISLRMALRIVERWLDTPFEGGRHAVRIRQIDPPSR